MKIGTNREKWISREIGVLIKVIPKNVRCLVNLAKSDTYCVVITEIGHIILSVGYQAGAINNKFIGCGF